MRKLLGRSLLRLLIVASLVVLILSSGGHHVKAAGTPVLLKEFSSKGYLDKQQYWNCYIDNKDIHLTLFDVGAEDGRNTMVSIGEDGGIGYDFYDEITSGKSEWVLDLSGAPDGVYILAFFEAKEGDKSGSLQQVSACYILIKDNYPYLYFPSASGEESFYNSLSKYAPSDYDGLPAFALDMSHLDELINLTDSLTKGCKTTEQKVKVIHDWIAQNISYDYTYEAANPDFVFEKRRAVCSGYSSLARVMYGIAKIPCLNISGSSNGIGHEWNAVYVNGRWNLIDITWDSQNKYHGANDSRNIVGQAPKYEYYGISPVLMSLGRESSAVFGASDVIGITVSMNGYTVISPILDRINDPDIMDLFYIGEKFELNPSVEYITVTGDSKEMNLETKESCNVSGYNMSKAGVQTVEVLYRSWKTSYKIYVLGEEDAIQYPAGQNPYQKAADGSATGKGASAAAAEAAITSSASDEGPKGSRYAPLQLRSTKQANTSITLVWNGVSGARKYVVYGNACGKYNKMKKLATITGKAFNASKLANGKTLAKGTYHKFMVVALDANNNVVSTSKVIHVATKGNKKIGNPTKVTTKKVKALKKGKTFKLGAKQVGKKVKKHRGLAYETSNAKVATISSKGVIKAVGKGTCYVYAYAQNGVFKKVKVVVK